MADFAPDAFNIWGNFNKDQKKDGHYWSAMEVPVSELQIAARIKKARNASSFAPT